jgi:putative ABC transport system substrate-binding protein
VITRRSALIVLGATAVAPGVAFTQSRQPVLIGWLHSDSLESSTQNLRAFKEGLAALGWKEGAQYVIDERWANGRLDQLQRLADELATRNPAVIVVALSVAVPSAAKAAPQTPIVMIGGDDPVKQGFVKSLARPGGLITGLTTVSTDVAEKHLELLSAAAPKVKRVGVLGDPRSPITASMHEAVRRVAGKYRVEARFAHVTSPEEIEAAVSRLAKEGVQGLMVAGGPIVRIERSLIVRLALTHRWPLIGGQGGWAHAGGLLSYSADVLATYRRAAYYVDRVLKGAKPGDLPIEQPTKFELVINLRTAKMLGLTIPQELLLRADQVIE